MNDLVVISADVDIEASLRAILSRPDSLGTRHLTVEFLRHPGHDPGVFTSGDELARNSRNTASHALLVLDMAWEGNPHNNPAALEADIESRLEPIWGDRAKVVAIQPEVEIWVWSTSPHVATQLGWNSNEEFHSWLEQEGLWPEGCEKPPDPKAAFEAAARKSRTVASSALFGEILKRVSLSKCSDGSFTGMRDWLRHRFPG